MELWGIQPHAQGPSRGRLGVLIPLLPALGVLLWQAYTSGRPLQLMAHPMQELVAFGCGLLFARLLVDCTPPLGVRRSPGYWRRLLWICASSLALPLAIPAVYCALMLGLPALLQQGGAG